MSIVPIYRLRATGEEKDPKRYRFSREPTPDPNPHPGKDDEDYDTLWLVEAVAFYAWSDQFEDGRLRAELRPVYEFHRCEERRHHYYYSLNPDAPKGWHKRPYVAFWAHEEDVEDGAPPIYRFRQEIPGIDNFVLSASKEVEGWKREEGQAFFASERIPVHVSVRPNWRNRREYDWTFMPSTVNLAYGSILEFVPAADSDFVFTGFEVVDGGKDFEPPDVRKDRVQLRALYTDRGRDYKYNVRVRVGSTSEEISGDPEIVNQRPGP